MIPRFLFPFLPYRSFFFPFLVTTAIVVPCWLIFRVYRHRTLGRSISLSREVLLLTFVVYIFGLALATLSPNHNSRQAAAAAKGIDLRPNLESLTCTSPNLQSGSPARAFCVRNAKGNFMLFFPLGFLIPLVWERLRFWRVILIAVAVSISIEIVQYLSRTWSNRTADVNDVILNVVGACLGLMLVLLLRSLVKPVSVFHRL